MELIGIELTKIVSLFYVGNSNAQPLRTELAAAFAQRYSFAAAPTKVEDFISNKTVFSLGKFQENGIDNLEVFSDGIVVAAKISSEKLDAFIEDVFKWTDEVFGLERIKTHTVEKVYESHLVVRTDKKIFSFLNKLSNIQIELQNKLNESSGIDVKFDQFGFTLAADNSLIGSMKPVTFRLERKLDASFASDLFFSSAPLKTVDHIALLEKIEALA
jgi:hypothetical protein